MNKTKLMKHHNGFFLGCLIVIHFNWNTFGRLFSVRNFKVVSFQFALDWAKQSASVGNPQQGQAHCRSLTLVEWFRWKLGRMGSSCAPSCLLGEERRGKSQLLRSHQCEAKLPGYGAAGWQAGMGGRRSHCSSPLFFFLLGFWLLVNTLHNALCL